ncbi:hypothetical protein Tco_0538192 [Tanacetum coccineum]
MRQLMCLEELSDEFAATKAKPQRANKNDTQWFQKEKVIKENSDSIASLRSEVASLKFKVGVGNSNERDREEDAQSGPSDSRLTMCIKWFQELEEDLLFEQEKHMRMLESTEQKCCDMDVARHNSLRPVPVTVTGRHLNDDMAHNLHGISGILIKKLGMGRSGILFNGALHWFWFDYKNTSDKKILIASFDLAKEEFREIPQPDDSRYLWNFGYSLGIMDGRLCIYPLFDDADDFPSCGTWVIKNYNAEPSWELLLNDCGLSRSMDYIPSPIFVQTLVSPYVNNNRGPSHANNNKITANARSVQEMRDTTRNRRTGDELFPSDICRWGMCTKRQK